MPSNQVFNQSNYYFYHYELFYINVVNNNLHTDFKLTNVNAKVCEKYIHESGIPYRHRNCRHR